jgi:plasmid stabilization system protein ParE
MAKKKNYILTALAEEDLRKARSWSLSRWGAQLTKAYFSDLHEGAESIAKNHKSSQARDNLTGDTGLFINAIREHYLVYVPITDHQIVIVAVMRQTRDVPTLLQQEGYKIRREINTIKRKIEQGKIKHPA